MPTGFPEINIWSFIPMIWGGFSPGLLMKMPSGWSDKVRMFATIAYHAIGAVCFILASGYVPEVKTATWLGTQTIFYTILSYLGFWRNVYIEGRIEDEDEPKEGAPRRANLVRGMKALSMR